MRPSHRMEIRIPRPIKLFLRQSNTKNPIIPLEIQTAHMKFPSQILQEEIIVVDPPRFILPKAIHNQTITSQIWYIREGIFTSVGCNINFQIGKRGAGS